MNGRSDFIEEMLIAQRCRGGGGFLFKREFPSRERSLDVWGPAEDAVEGNPKASRRAVAGLVFQDVLM